jgi:hypothetical protein
MKSFYGAGWLCVSVLVLAACGGGGQTTASNTTNAAAPAAPAPAENATADESASGDEAAPSDGAANQDFTLVNNTGHTVMTLNVSPSDSNQWGPDILGQNVLPNGQSAQVSFERGQDQCEWDIRATYDDGDTTDARGANLCQISTVTLTGE